MPVPRWKPQANSDPAYPATLVSEGRRVITTGGFQNVPDAMTSMLLLPGIPDILEAHVIDFAAVLTVTDEQGREANEITVTPGTATSTLPRNRLIRARNLAAGSTAKLQIIARWL